MIIYYIVNIYITYNMQYNNPHADESQIYIPFLTSPFTSRLVYLTAYWYFHLNICISSFNMSQTKFLISFLKLAPAAASSISVGGKAIPLVAQAQNSGVLFIFPLKPRAVVLYKGSGTLGLGQVGVENSLWLPILAMPCPVQGCVCWEQGTPFANHTEVSSGSPAPGRRTSTPPSLV